MPLLRARFKTDIVAEFLLPQGHNRCRESHTVCPHTRVIILCDGMPSVPHKRRVLEFFSRKGFWVFHPRYRGTWESGGQFLKDDPTRDVLDVIDELQTGRVASIWDNETYEIAPKEFFVFGGSFGGPAAILASLDSRVTKAVAISPVVDWAALSESEIEPPELLERRVQMAFGQAYRFSHEDWLRLSRNELYTPMRHVEEFDGSKLFLIHTKDDAVVPAGPVQQFAAQIGCVFLLLKKGGHLGLSTLTRWRLWRRIKKHL